ncbi:MULTISPECIES: efflux RND transporter permease subunit [Rhodomicrobium]|uniref:efflux RND transporter permease subunit n=1 Tax=Rhodomicrobium TaxID=1068 RepID=UPI000B4AAA98|nr:MULTISPECIES: efflux RND transporter permease subunit [Rhodomicrobium]
MSKPFKLPEQPQRGFNLSRWAIQHASLTRFLVVLILAAGGLSLFSMGQKEDPDFTFRVMVIQVQWPGASTEEMQSQVVDKIERKAQEAPHLDFVRSYTRPGSAVVFVNFRGEARGREITDGFYEVRKKIRDIQQTFPAGVIGPFYNDEFGDTYITLHALTGDGFGYPELKTEAKHIRDILLRVPGIEKVDLLGTQDERVFIEVSSKVLAERNLSPQDIQAALAAQNTLEPAGRVESDARSVRLDVEGFLLSVDEIRELRLRIGGDTIRLGDIATVTRGLQDPPVAKTRYQGREAVLIGVVMAKGAKVTDVGKAIEAALTKVKAALPLGLELGQIADQPDVVTKYVGEFLEALGEALLIVLGVSFLFLGWRAGLVVALTIPLVLGATFLTMSIMGIDLQRISLGALIIALGLLVDDAMIAVEMMERKLQEGLDKLSAASFAYNSTAFPMLTGTLITVSGFIPVGFAASTAGEYVGSLFWVVGIALIISWIAAVYFTPWIGHALLKPHKVEGTPKHPPFKGPFYRRLERAIEWCVMRRRVVVAMTLAAFVAGIVGFGFIPQQFFPASNRPEVLVDLWLPEGASFRQVETQAKAVEAEMMADPDVKFVTTFVGEGAPRFYLPLDQQLRNPNFAQLLVMPKSLEQRDPVILKLRKLLADHYPEIRSKVDRLFNGPPVGWPIQLRVTGPEREEVRRIAGEVAATMRANPLITVVHNDWLEPVPALKLDIDQDRARAIGVSSQAVRQTLQAVLTGVTIGEFREGEETISVLLREPKIAGDAFGAVEAAYVKTASGASVPLAQIAKINVVMEPGIEWRRSRLPTISVRGTVPDSVQSPDVTKAIYAQLQPLRDALPLGYRIEMQGAVEESAISQDSINAKMPVMLLAIVLLLMIQLQHVGKTAIVLATGPLGIIGAAAALLIFQSPFGFVAILGVIALAGMIMRNSVILVDQIQQDREAGIPVGEAIVGSTVRRFRPIVLTAAAAVLALVPLSTSLFWGPMALAMMGGLVAGTILTLTFLPALYALSFGIGVKTAEGQVAPEQSVYPEQRPAPAYFMPQAGE